MGTYHILGGARCRIAYPGNVQTCARCHNFPKACPGSGMAKSCEEKGGKRRSLSDHMRRVWAKLSGEDPNLDDSFNVIEHQFVTQSVKDSKSNMITANGKPHGAEIIRDLESETPDKKGDISETVLTTKETSSDVVNTVGHETLQGPPPSPSETGDDGNNPPPSEPPPSDHPPSDPLLKEGSNEKDLKGASDYPNLRDPETPPASKKVNDFLEHSNLELATLGGEGSKVVNEVGGTEASDSESYQDVSEEEEEKTSVLKQLEDGKGKSIKSELHKANAFQRLKQAPLHSTPKASKLPKGKKKRKQEDRSPDQENGGKTQKKK